MKTISLRTLLSAVGILMFFNLCGQPLSQKIDAAREVMPPDIQARDFGGFSITVPTGWQIFQYGSCSDNSFISWDPRHPERQFFNFGLVGPFYTDVAQKVVNDQYTVYSGQRTPLTGTPIINPLTPENFLKQFFLIEEMPQVKSIFRKLPGLKNIQIISSSPLQSGITKVPSSSAIMRAVFTNESKTAASEGLFLVTVVPFQVTSYGPSARFGLAASFIGITADINDFESVMPILKKCLDEYTIQQSYVQNCINDSNRQWREVQEVGKTLVEGSQNIMSAWRNKNQSQDINSQKTSDWIRGRERLYDPLTNETYTVDNTFIDRYNSDRNKFNKPNLERLPPNDHRLWTTPPQNGDQIKRID